MVQLRSRRRTSDSNHERSVDWGDDSGDDVDQFVKHRHENTPRHTASRRKDEGVTSQGWKQNIDDGDDDDDGGGGGGDEDNNPFIQHSAVLDLGIGSMSDASDDTYDQQHNHLHFQAYGDEEMNDQEQATDDEDLVDLGMGQKKKDFYGADNADYELMSTSSEEENLKEEEEQVLKLQGKHTAMLTAQDFGFEHDDPENDDTTIQHNKGKYSQKYSKKLSLQEDLDIEKTSSFRKHFNVPDFPENIETITKSITKMSEKEKIQVIRRMAPELMPLQQELHDALAIISKNKSQSLVDPSFMDADDLTHFSQDKINALRANVLMNYCTNVAFYFTLKAESQEVLDHPVFEVLLKHKLLLQRLDKLKIYLKTCEQIWRKSNKISAPDDDEDDADTNTDDDADDLGEHDGNQFDVSDSSDGQDVNEILVEKRQNHKEEKDAFLASMFENDPTKDKTHLTNRPPKKQPLSNVHAFISMVEQENMLGLRNHEKKSGDMDHVYDPTGTNNHKKKKQEHLSDDSLKNEENYMQLQRGCNINEDEEDEIYLNTKKKVEEAKAAKKKKKEKKMDLYSYDDGVDESGRREASKEILANRGLTPRRPKKKKNPRKKHRLKFEAASARRKGAVKEHQTGTASYGGELSGINKSVKKSVRFK